MSTTTATSLPTAADLRAAVRAAFDAIGVRTGLAEPGVHGLQASTPVTGNILFTVAETTADQMQDAIAAAAQAFSAWRTTPVAGSLVSTRSSFS